VFKNKSIESRRFGLKNLQTVLEKDHDAINARFQESATELSAQSLNAALTKAQLNPRDIDCLFTTTCTGYLCPGLSSYIIEACHLNPNVQYADLTGMGCAAAVPALHHAANFVRANPGTRAAVVSTEICSAAMFTGDEPDLIVSNGIFADGSATMILSSVESDLALGTLVDFASVVQPAHRDEIRFTSKNGYLRNVLSKNVPEMTATALEKLTSRLLKKNNVSKADVAHWLLHSGGEKILKSIATASGLHNGQLDSSRAILRERGNMSSPTVFYVLEHRLKTSPPKKGEWGIIASFGAGFSTHAALVRF
jgi:alkylresorcinol/alkylpyrone synthase